jgi:hypothetical protein
MHYIPCGKTHKHPHFASSPRNEKDGMQYLENDASSSAEIDRDT